MADSKKPKNPRPISNPSSNFDKFLDELEEFVVKKVDQRIEETLTNAGKMKTIFLKLLERWFDIYPKSFSDQLILRNEELQKEVNNNSYKRYSYELELKVGELEQQILGLKTENRKFLNQLEIKNLQDNEKVGYEGIATDDQLKQEFQLFQTEFKKFVGKMTRSRQEEPVQRNVVMATFFLFLNDQLLNINPFFFNRHQFNELLRELSEKNCSNYDEYIDAFCEQIDAFCESLKKINYYLCKNPNILIYYPELGTRYDKDNSSSYPNRDENEADQDLVIYACWVPGIKKDEKILLPPIVGVK